MQALRRPGTETGQATDSPRIILKIWSMDYLSLSRQEINKF